VAAVRVWEAIFSLEQAEERSTSPEAQRMQRRQKRNECEGEEAQHHIHTIILAYGASKAFIAW